MKFMKKKGNLHLVTFNSKPKNESFRNKIDNIFNILFISKNEKIYILKDILINIYRDYEITTGICDIPYFVKAEAKLSEIIKDKKINYYYNRLKRFKKNL